MPLKAIVLLYDFDTGTASGCGGHKKPSPTTRRLERSLDPASEEDPDLAVELIDGVYHQLSIDNALVAIMADYPGLCPASPVSTTEVLAPLLL